MDKLKLLRGEPLALSDSITVHQPTLSEICEYGEEAYFRLIKRLTATPFEYKAALWDMGIDYEDVDEFDLFITLSRELTQSETHIVLPGLNFSKMEVRAAGNDEKAPLFLYSRERNAYMDKVTYERMTEFLREINNFEKNQKKPGNLTTKKIYIEMDRLEAEHSKGKPFQSLLLPIISALVNMPGFKYNYATVWNMPVYAFFDALKRTQKIKIADNVSLGVYTGNIDSAKVKKELNWLE